MPDIENASASPAVPETETTQAAETTTPVAAAPPPADSADLQALRAALAEKETTIAMLREGYNTLASAIQQRPGPAAPAELTDDQLEQMVAEGKTAQAMQIVAERAARRTAQHLRETEIAPLQNEVRGMGLPAIGALAIEQVKPTLRHYDRYKAETDRAVQSLAPELQMRPDNIRLAHSVVLGQHTEELEREAYERGIRAARENPASLPGGRVAGTGTEAIPSAEDIYGKGSEQARMVAAAGGEDAFVQKYFQGRYATWADYVPFIKGTEGTA